MDTVSDKIIQIKVEIKEISTIINKSPKSDLQVRLDKCLRNLGFLTLNHPEEQDIDLLKEHTWALIEKLSRRIV